MVRRTAPRVWRTASPARTAACALALALGLSACAAPEFRRIPRERHPHASGAGAATRLQREADMNRRWQNRPLSELFASLGRPKMVVHIPGGGMPPSYAVVYGHDPDSGCIDAFAITLDAEPLVRIYHCR